MFDQEAIDKVRESAGDEVADQMVQQNRKEAHDARITQLQVDPKFEENFPHMSKGIKSGVIQVPVTDSPEALENYLQTRENEFEAMMPKPPEQQQQDPTQQQQQQQQMQQQDPTQQQNPLANVEFSQTRGLFPWSEDAQAAISPTAPGDPVSQTDVMVEAVRETMEPEEGQYTSDRDRRRDLVRNMESCNLTAQGKDGIGGTQKMRAMRKGYEDPDTFPLA